MIADFMSCASNILAQLVNGDQKLSAQLSQLPLGPSPLLAAPRTSSTFLTRRRWEKDRCLDLAGTPTSLATCWLSLSLSLARLAWSTEIGSETCPFAKRRC